MTTSALRAAGWRPLIARLPCQNFRRESSKVTSVHDIYSGRRKQLELQRQREEQRVALEAGQPPVEDGSDRPATYATVAEYETRAGRHVYDENTGIKPSKRQRFWLVAMRIYPTRASVPEFVGAGDLNRMSNRFRVFYITSMVAFLGVIFLFSETQMHKKILHDGAQRADQRAAD